MNRHLYLLPILLLLGCSRNNECPVAPTKSPNTSAYKPILMDKAALKTSVTAKAAVNLNSPGRIFSDGNYLYVCERYKGVHVYDNTDPKNPQQKTFISIPGSFDMAVKGNMLYV